MGEKTSKQNKMKHRTDIDVAKKKNFPEIQYRKIKVFYVNLNLYFLFIFIIF